LKEAVLGYFSGKVVLITGSAGGIGFATASLLGSLGAKIVISDIMPDHVEKARKTLADKNIEVMAKCCDVTSPEDCKILVNKTIEKFEKLDIVINNAGISIVSNFEEIKPEVAKKLIDVNVMGSIYMSMAALDELKKSKGHLIFMASVSGVRAIPTGSIYSMSKASVRSLAESIRLELKDYGVHVGVITPGFTTTESSKTVLKGDGEKRPIDRPPHDTPEGVAKGIAKLIENRERERVLTPLGKATFILQRISPTLVDWYLTGKELKN
jgi:dehydrogenase/reductase SDR family member 7B